MSNIKLLEALFKVQQEMQPVIKGHKNPFFKSNYATINDLREELMPLLEKNGLLLLQPNSHIDNKNFITTTVYHIESGTEISSLHEVVVAKQNDPQAFLAAQTYARRGAIQTLFNMSTKDDDGSYASGRADKLEEIPVKKGFSKESTQLSAPVVPLAQSSVTQAPKTEEKKEEPVKSTSSFRRRQ